MVGRERCFEENPQWFMWNSHGIYWQFDDLVGANSCGSPWIQLINIVLFSPCSHILISIRSISRSRFLHDILLNNEEEPHRQAISMMINMSSPCWCLSSWCCWLRNIRTWCFMKIGIYHPVCVLLQGPLEGRHIPSNRLPTSLPFAFTFPFCFTFGSASVKKNNTNKSNNAATP